jgi:hypothetical protein
MTDRAEELARKLDAILVGEKNGDVMRAFGICIASMSLHARGGFIEESIDSLRSAAEEWFKRCAKDALQ